MGKQVYLILENGRVFPGWSFGASGETIGELVFTTAMTGYLETLTDPSYYGQMVVQTFPLIGNYGVIPADFESEKPHVRAYIVRNWCQEPSNFRCQGELDTFLKNNQIIGLYGIDTRALTRIVREYGVMNARISFTPDATEEVLAQIKSYTVKDAVKSVSHTETATHQPENCRASHRVVLWDFGAKANIERELLKRGCEVICVPADTTCEQILSYQPDGIMLSNGPGDPAENVEIIQELRKLNQAGKPIFGICLGHQLLALAHGAKTVKLKYGHRGANQPALETATGRVYITSQNHGYAVLGETLPVSARVSYMNANDQTCEGIDYTDAPMFSVQFHPEASAGPLDTSFLFDGFISLMQGGKR